MSGDGAIAARPPRLIVPVLAVAATSASFVQSLVIPLLGALPGIFQASPADTPWALTATLLAAAIGTPVAGRLADRYGKRRVLIPMLGIVVIGSLVAATATSLVVLIAGRALQGAMLAVVPLATSVLRDVLPARQLTRAVGWVNSSLGVGGALGFPLSAVIYQAAGWRALFWSAVVISIGVLVLTVAFVPHDSSSERGRFDIVGAVVLAIALAGILIPISRAPVWGATSPLTLGILGAALLLLVGWVWWERRIESPFVDLRLALRRAVLTTNIGATCLGFASFGFQVATPLLITTAPQSGFGLGGSMILAGLCRMPAGLMMLGLSPIGARVSDQFGAKVSFVVGGLVIGAAYLVSPVLTSSIPSLIALSALLGVGFGFTFGSIPTLLVSSVPPSQTAAVNGLSSLARSSGSAVGSTVFALLIAGSLASGHPGEGIAGIYLAAGVVMLVGVAAVLLNPARPTAAP